MSISRKTDRTHRIPQIRPAGRRWMSIDIWLKAYEAAQDPNGKYGRVGKDPQNVVVNLKEAS